MITQHHCVHIAHLVIETEAPLSLSSGQDDLIYDMQLCRDANGLPTIPGTAIAGVLRHLYQDRTDSIEKTNKLFGNTENDTGSTSSLHVSWGYIHDENDKPVEGILFDETLIKSDPILTLALQEQPINRDHIRINHRGTTANQAKFDRAALPAGYRFSIELCLWSDHLENEDWKVLLQLVESPAFRLGGATRRGYGALKIKSLETNNFDLKQADDYEKYTALSINMSELAPNYDKTQQNNKETPYIQASVNLTAEDFWQVGQGDIQLSKEANTAKSLQRVEPFIHWNNDNKATISHHIVIPASSIKGVIAHRLDYHYRRHTNDFTKKGTQLTEKITDATEHLFGIINENGAHTGQVIINDATSTLDFNNPPIGIMQHNSIDRFTGGVRKGMLFTEELIYNTPVNFTFTILNESIKVTEQAIRYALRDTFADLTEGRLALGAASSKGHGYFSGEVIWNKAGNEWLGEDAS